MVLLAARIFVLLLSCTVAFAVDCQCDASKSETFQERQCSLCVEAEKQPQETRIFFLKDINPRKPNRWLALPRAHGAGAHHLHDLPPRERAELWKAAIEKARSLFGGAWGLAYNGEKVRTQCHLHIHIGKLLEGVERDVSVLTVGDVSQIPARPGEGVWVHPKGNRLHVHIGEQTTETALLR